MSITDYTVAEINAVGSIYTIIARTDTDAAARRLAGIVDPDALDTVYTVRVSSGPVFENCPEAIAVTWNEAMDFVRNEIAAELQENTYSPLPPPRITRRK